MEDIQKYEIIRYQDQKKTWNTKKWKWRNLWCGYITFLLPNFTIMTRFIKPIEPLLTFLKNQPFFQKKCLKAISSHFQPGCKFFFSDSSGFLAYQYVLFVNYPKFVPVTSFSWHKSPDYIDYMAMMVLTKFQVKPSAGGSENETDTTKRVVFDFSK